MFILQNLVWYVFENILADGLSLWQPAGNLSFLSFFNWTIIMYRLDFYIQNIRTYIEVDTFNVFILP